jgi:hypothetical protein
MMVAFQQEVSEFTKTFMGTLTFLNTINKEVATSKQTILSLPNTKNNLMEKLDSIESELRTISFRFYGTEPKASWEEVPPAEMPLYNRLNSIIEAQITSTSEITGTSKSSFAILKVEFPPLLERMSKIYTQELTEIRKQLDEMKAPYTPGRIPKLDIEK